MNQFLKDAWQETSHTKNIFWCNKFWVLSATLIKLDQSIKGECETKNKQQTKDLQNHIEICKGGTVEQQNNIIEDVDKITDKSDGVKNRSPLEMQNKSGIDKLISSDAINKKRWQFKPSLRRQRQRGEPIKRSVLRQKSWNWHFGAEESGEIHVLGARSFP